MYRNHKHLNVSTSYEDFKEFVDIFGPWRRMDGWFREDNFSSMRHWRIYLQRLRDLQIKIAAESDYVFISEKDKKRLEKIANDNISGIIDDILTVMDLGEAVNFRLKERINVDQKWKASNLWDAFRFVPKMLTPEAKKRIRKLREEERNLEKDENISKGDKIIRLHYIKAEINEIKEGPNYMKERHVMIDSSLFKVAFEHSIWDILKNDVKLKEEKWKKKYGDYKYKGYYSQNTELYKAWDSGEVLFVHGGLIDCLRNNHDTVSIKAIVHDLNGKHKINATHCNDCGINFISNKELDYYNDLYGHVIANFRWVKQDGSFNSGDEFDMPINKSVLYLCGYSVSAEADLTEEQRQQILKKIIDENILKKERVIEYLNYFINTNGRVKNHENARDKWMTDIEFVRNYKLEDQDEVNIYRLEKK